MDMKKHDQMDIIVIALMKNISVRPIINVKTLQIGRLIQFNAQCSGFNSGA